MTVRISVIFTALLLAGCASTGNVPVSGTEFRLDGCPPLLNCVSSNSSIAPYYIKPIELTGPLNPVSWGVIVTVASDLPGARVKESRFGYLEVNCYSELFHFPDYLEVLVSQDGQRLDVRSQSQFGLFDFNVNRRRVERFRAQLIEQGVAVSRQ